MLDSHYEALIRAFQDLHHSQGTKPKASVSEVLERANNRYGEALRRLAET